MSGFNDLADYIMRNQNKGSQGGSAGLSSDSEADDLPEAKITLPEDY